jgi:hypothetical protein
LKQESDMGRVMRPDSPAKFVADEAADDARRVRRIFLVALGAAMLAAAVTLVVELILQRAPAPAPSVLPVTFRQPGFVDHVLHRVATSDQRSGRLQGVLHVESSAGPLYVVVRCDTGRVTVVADSLTSVQACTGAPVGVVALARVRRPTQLDVTVSRPQQGRWAVGVYR